MGFEKYNEELKEFMKNYDQNKEDLKHKPVHGMSIKRVINEAEDQINSKRLKYDDDQDLNEADSIAEWNTFKQQLIIIQ